MMTTPTTPTPTQTAQRAFEAYKSLGPTRNLHKLAEVTGLSHNSLKKWQAAYKWREACAAHDAQTQSQVTAPQRASTAPLSPAEIVHEHTHITQKLYATLSSVLTTINSTLEQAVTERDAGMIRSLNALTTMAERLYKRSAAEYDKVTAAQKQSLERNEDKSRNAVGNLIKIDGMIGSIRRYLDDHQPETESAGGDDAE